MIDSIILNNSNGIYHVGTKRKSVFDLARKIKDDIKPISRLSIKNVTIPYDTSFE